MLPAVFDLVSVLFEEGVGKLSERVRGWLYSAIFWRERRRLMDPSRLLKRYRELSMSGSDLLLSRAYERLLERCRISYGSLCGCRDGCREVFVAGVVEEVVRGELFFKISSYTLGGWVELLRSLLEPYAGFFAKGECGVPEECMERD